MRQTVAIVASVLGGLLLVGCGNSTPAPPDASTPFDVTTAIPADGDVTGFTKNTDSSKDGVFKTKTEVEGSVNGDLTPFEEKGFVLLARQHYLGAGLGAGGADYAVDFRIWQMKDDATGKVIYDYLRETVLRYSSLTWTDEAIGEGGRSANSGVMWRVNCYKKAYFVEAVLDESEATDTAGKEAAIKFVKAAADKLP